MKQPTIFIEGLGLVEGHFSGIGQYILGTLRGFDELIEEASLNNQPHPKVYVLIPYNTLRRFNEFGFRYIKAWPLPFSFRWMNAGWVLGKLPPLDLICGPGHYLFTRFVGMPLVYSKSSQIIYDLSYELHPEFGDDPNVKFLSRGVRKSIQRSHRIFTISQSSKRDIAKFYEIDADRITVGYPAVDQRFFFKRSPAEISAVKQRYGIKGNYIISLSNVEPRKNLNSLVEAYCSLDKPITDELGLLIVGVNGWKTDEIFSQIIDRVAEGYNIMRPSEYVKDADKPAIVSGASMLVYPSFYEGFGIPPLEALACGVPAMVADNSSLPEAIGKVGKKTGTDAKTIAADMQAIIERLDEESKFVATAGPEHAASFSWKETARTFLDAMLEDAT